MFYRAICNALNLGINSTGIGAGGFHDSPARRFAEALGGAGCVALGSESQNNDDWMPGGSGLLVPDVGQFPVIPGTVVRADASLLSPKAKATRGPITEGCVTVIIFQRKTAITKRFSDKPSFMGPHARTSTSSSTMTSCLWCPLACRTMMP